MHMPATGENAIQESDINTFIQESRFRCGHQGVNTGVCGGVVNQWGSSMELTEWGLALLAVGVGIPEGGTTR